MIVDRSCALREPRSASARSQIFAFRDPPMQVKKPPPFDKAQPFKDLGLRHVNGNANGSDLQIEEVESRDGRLTRAGSEWVRCSNTEAQTQRTSKK